MVIAHYGSGVYMYTAYAFYRELPLGVPGAYRIFANLLSLSKNPLLKRESGKVGRECALWLLSSLYTGVPSWS